MIRALLLRNGRRTPDEAAPAAIPSPETDAARAADRDLYWRIGSFLFEQALPPTPAYYRLAHIYVLGSDDGIVAAVDAAIAEGEGLSGRMADSILAAAGLGDTGLSPALFDRLAGQTEVRFDRVSGLVDRSQADARRFGDALEANAAGFTAMGVIDTPIAAALLELAGAMIASTRHAEARLRETAGEMDDLRVKLAAARLDAETDMLTGLPNRRAFDRRLCEAREAALANGTALAIALVDIDRFKNVNDEHGHDVGDRVLQLFARTLGDACSPHLVSRRGGEEFALLFVGLPLTDAFALLDDARVAIAGRALRVAETRRTLGQLTFSGGIVALDGTESGEALLRQADTLLYRAKRDGRNRLAR